jgi:hypothetical protein
MSKSKRKARQAKERPPVDDPPIVPAPGRYEGAGMEDLDAALEEVEFPEPPEDDSEPVDLSDPDAKAAWLELYTEAKINGDEEAAGKLVAMLPELPAEESDE